MNLQNGYKVIFEKIADGERTFFADKLDGTAAVQIGDAVKIGQYKLVYEKDGQIYGSVSGVPASDDHCFADFDIVFKTAKVESEVPHVHNFVEGKCECGEEDPDYAAPHVHNFVEGKCECGEEDPSYVPPVPAPSSLED